MTGTTLSNSTRSRSITIRKLAENKFKGLAYQFPLAITAKPYLMAQPLESPQVRQALLLEQILEVQRKTVDLMSALVKLSKRSWFEWTLWGFALVAAVVGLIALFAK